MSIANISSVHGVVSEMATNVVEEAKIASPLFLCISIAVGLGVIVAGRCVVKSLSGRVQSASIQGTSQPSSSQVRNAQPAEIEQFTSMAEYPDNAQFAICLQNLQSTNPQTRTLGWWDFFKLFPPIDNGQRNDFPNRTRTLEYALSLVATKGGQRTEGKNNNLHGWRCDPKAPLWQRETNMEACKITLRLMFAGLLDSTQPQEVQMAYKVYYGTEHALLFQVPAFQALLEKRGRLAVAFARMIVSEWNRTIRPNQNIAFYEILLTLKQINQAPPDIVAVALERTDDDPSLKHYFQALLQAGSPPSS